MPHVLNPLYVVVTKVILAIHSVLTPLFGKTSGVSWGLSLFFLTVLVRILLFPIFVKQIKTQRAMSELAPKVKELQTKYKKDRERMNQEVMALYKEHNANPLMGCLPLLLQMPVFYALFHVLRYIAEHGGQAGATSKGVAACTAYLQTKPKGFGSAKYGWSPDSLCTAGHAKVFGVPLALGFKTASKAVSFGADPSTVRIVTVIAIIVMASTTFLTQRQLIARNAASGTAMPSQQRIMLYVLPPLFALFGLNFQMGVLIYWVTTNVWSLGQQHFVIKAMPHIAPGGAPPPTAPTKGSPPPGDKPGDPPSGGKKRGPTPPASPPPPVVIRRQQTNRPPRSKRTGTRPPRPGSPR
ncbi:MAG TPA: membrane protein insertase YidC [Acidothermaceae bacterium]|nr:membrane protein insertase YidC [Acidothermaceae bacterium]